jgi:hypothetical protein
MLIKISLHTSLLPNISSMKLLSEKRITIPMIILYTIKRVNNIPNPTLPTNNNTLILLKKKKNTNNNKNN